MIETQDQFATVEVSQTEAALTVVKLSCGVQVVIAASCNTSLDQALHELVPEHLFDAGRFQMATITQRKASE